MESGFLVSSPSPALVLLPDAWGLWLCPSTSQPLAMGSVALALSAGPPLFPSPCLALPPGVELASPHGASARPGLLAARSTYL